MCSIDLKVYLKYYFSMKSSILEFLTISPFFFFSSPTSLLSLSLISPCSPSSLYSLSRGNKPI